MAGNRWREATYIYLLPFLLAAFSPLAKSQNVQSMEKQILLQLKEEWGNPPALSSWNSTDTTYCNWFGIQCTTDGSINSIALVNQDSNIAISSSLCDLENLSYLDLSYNNITGSFPTALYNCTNLEYLDISQNLYEGELPRDIYRLSSRLSTLNLAANDFAGDIPASVGRLQSLQNLQFHYNAFNGTFPVELSNLTALQTLTLATNPFIPMSIPSEFGNLTKLNFLWMAEMNLIGDIPNEFSKLESMEQLDLTINSLTGTIPAGIWKLPNLKKLYLYKNNLSGPVTIDGEIEASGLKEIDLSINQLNGSIPEQFGKLQNLSILFLYYNQFSGDIPTNIGQLQSLTDLRLFNNNLTGALPTELGRNSFLWNIEVDNNMLSGELPVDLCAKDNLTSIIVYKNNMSGKIPPSLGNCVTLNNFQIYKNQFSGELPDGIWSAKNLTTMMVHDNALTGNIPDSLPWNLTRLEIQNNQFSGSIPSSAPRLLVFLANNNLFSGELPNLTGISQLQSLSLGGNKISGKIPEDISQLKFLTDLNLSYNLLNGSIPETIGSLPVLRTLDLSVNELSGEIPSSITNLNLNFLNLSSNQLSGEIPSSLENEVYDRSFLANPSLCASNSLLDIPSCRSQSGRSNGISKGLRTFLIVLGALVFLIVCMLIIFIVRDCRKRRKGDELINWKLTSFQSLNFTETNVLRGLKEENLIGNGGSGEVYRIDIANRDGTTVAVKKIWNSRKLDPMIERQFESEVQILGSIRHTNIIKLLCCISSDDSKLLVYEYMENGNLNNWLHQKPEVTRSQRAQLLDWPARLRIAIGAAQGLSYMHHDCSPPIIHRDIKSSNILLDSGLRAKIADFGLARILMKINEPETVSVVAGTFGYMAPECAYSMKVNEKADVYSFGVVLLELSTGREASDGGEQPNLAEWAWRHLQQGVKVADSLDKTIKEPQYIAEMAAVFRLGVMCTNTLPSTRPSMKDVLQILLHVNIKYGVEDTQNVEHDFAPLLHAKKIESQRRVI